MRIDLPGKLHRFKTPIVIFLIFTFLFVAKAASALAVIHWPREFYFVFFFSLLVVFFLKSGRVLTLIGVIFLSLCPLLIIQKNELLADRISSIAFIFLFFGVIKNLTSLFFNGADHSDLT